MMVLDSCLRRLQLRAERREDEEYEEGDSHAVNWENIVRHLRRIQRLRRIWAHLGRFLRNFKEH